MSSNDRRILEERHRARTAARGLRDAWEFDPHAGTTRGDYDRAFSKWFAEQGWIGLAIPEEAGGHGLSTLARLLITEEFLAVGAPLMAHWGGERQVAPTIVHLGSERVKSTVLPGLLGGTLMVSVGLSEPGAGSDLGGITTRADRVEGGWRITGQKIWTSDAQRNDMIEVLCRSDRSGGRHTGFTSVLVPLPDPTVTIRPIQFQNGDDYYAEVFFDGTFAPDSHVLGEPGSAWAQLTSELVNERAGAERYMATYPLVEQFVEHARGLPAVAEEVVRGIGRIYAKMTGLRQLAITLASGRTTQATLVSSALKDAGTLFEQDTVVWLRDLIAEHGDPVLLEDSAKQLLKSPLYTLGGGATEVLRSGIGKRIARGTGAPAMLLDDLSEDARETYGAVRDVLAAQPEPHERDLAPGLRLDLEWQPEVWTALTKAGWHMMGLAEELGGAGATGEQILGALYAVGAGGVSVPAVSSWLTVPWLHLVTGTAPKDVESLSVVAWPRETVTFTARDGGLALSAAPTSIRVVWGALADTVWLPVEVDGAPGFLRIARAAIKPVGVTVPLGEPSADIRLPSIVSTDAFVPCESEEIDRLRAIDALGHAALIQGAGERALGLAVEYVRVREQFGHPVGEFQLVQKLLVEIIESGMVSGALVNAAFEQFEAPAFDFEFLAAAAKASAGEFARVTAHHAHQALGAVGTTREHSLHRFTLRLRAWRESAGTDAVWERAIGRQVLDAGAFGGWQLLTGLR